MMIGILDCCRYIVTDCDSLDVYYNTQHYTKTPEEAAAKALLAGEFDILQIGHYAYDHIFYLRDKDSLFSIRN